MDKETTENTESTHVIRVTRSSEEIALRYGSTVSKGIVEMEYKLSHPVVQYSPGYQTEIMKSAGMATVPTSAGSGFVTANNFTPTSSQTSSYSLVDDKEYWKKMQNTISASLEPFCGRGV